jgi:hypothetical protein
MREGEGEGVGGRGPLETFFPHFGVLSKVNLGDVLLTIVGGPLLQASIGGQ